MEKLDLKKTYSQLYSVAKDKITIVEVPELQYIMIDGAGDPNSSVTFQQAIEALYSISYTLKFMIKKGITGIDYGVMPLEGLWWCDDMKHFSTEHKELWKWTLMIMQPEFISKDIYEQAYETVLKKKSDNPAVAQLRFETMTEGSAAQILHIGPFAEEAPTIARLHSYIKENGYRLTGKHREIYLSDMRKTAPERLKTIIRQPISK